MSIVVSKTRLPVTEWQTESGSVVSIANARRRDAKSAIVTLEPIQDLHGYANPWVGGAGINQCNPSTMGNGYIKNDGGISTGSNGERYMSDYVLITGSQVTAGYFNYSDGETPWVGIAFYDSNKTYKSRSAANANPRTVAVPTGAVYARATMRTYARGNEYCFCANGEVSTFSPYENLCPISGHTAVTVNHAGASQSDNPQSVTVQLGRTVYGGSVDLASGVGTLTMANIASYNGETIGEPWLSSMDKYVAGATPTTGAQVVYTLATPITFQLTPTQIEMLMRNNTIWSDDGIVAVNYARIRS